MRACKLGTFALQALAVGYELSGFALWSPAGCRLLAVLRPSAPQHAPRSPHASMPNGCGAAAEPHLAAHTGTAFLRWDQTCLRLLAADAGVADKLREFSFARPDSACHYLAAAGRRPGHEEVHVMHGADRLLLVTEALPGANAAAQCGPHVNLSIYFMSQLHLPHSCRRTYKALCNLFAGYADAIRMKPDLHIAWCTHQGRCRAGVDHLQTMGEDTDDLVVTHVLAPHAFLAACWPLRAVCTSDDAQDIAVAGSRGLALYDCRQRRWRLFRAAGQERRFCALHLGWLPDVVVCVQRALTGAASALTAAASGAGGPARLAQSGAGEAAAAGKGMACVAYSRFSLDEAHTLARLPLQTVCLLLYLLALTNAANSKGWLCAQDACARAFCMPQ